MRTWDEYEVCEASVNHVNKFIRDVLSPQKLVCWHNEEKILAKGGIKLIDRLDVSVIEKLRHIWSNGASITKTPLCLHSFSVADHNNQTIRPICR